MFCSLSIPGWASGWDCSAEEITSGKVWSSGPEALRVHYVHLATQALLKQWRIHGVSLSVKASADSCIEIMGPASDFRRFCGTEVQHKLPLESTYEGMLASLGPRTRRSLAGKRQQLEKSANVEFIPALDPDQSMEVMLALEAKSMPQRISKFFHARYRLLRVNSDFFSMGLRLPDGPWLSILSGWRRNGVTYVDLQMNDMHYKKESISAVMRAFMLEHEIGTQAEAHQLCWRVLLVAQKILRAHRSRAQKFLSGSPASAPISSRWPPRACYREASMSV